MEVGIGGMHVVCVAWVAAAAGGVAGLGAGRSAGVSWEAGGRRPCGLEAAAWPKPRAEGGRDEPLGEVVEEVVAEANFLGRAVSAAASRCRRPCI